MLNIITTSLLSIEIIQNSSESEYYHVIFSCSSTRSEYGLCLLLIIMRHFLIHYCVFHLLNFNDCIQSLHTFTLTEMYTYIRSASVENIILTLCTAINWVWRCVFEIANDNLLDLQN